MNWLRGEGAPTSCTAHSDITAKLINPAYRGSPFTWTRATITGQGIDMIIGA